MSVRVDTSSLVAGAVVVGHRGLGVTGATIRANTATGDHGPGYLYNDWDSGDDAKEFRGFIVTPPSAGTFYAYEDGSFSLVGAPDGAYTFVYRLYVDGVDTGTATANLAIGASNGSAAGAVAGLSLTAPNASATGTANATAAGVLAALQLVAPTGAAIGSGDALASGGIAALQLTAPTGSAAGTEAGSAVATGSLAALQLVPPQASASATANVIATGLLRAVSLVAPQGFAVGAGADPEVVTPSGRIWLIQADDRVTPIYQDDRVTPVYAD